MTFAEWAKAQGIDWLAAVNDPDGILYHARAAWDAAVAAERERIAADLVREGKCGQVGAPGSG